MFSHRRRVSLLGLTALVAASASTAYANCASPVNAIEAENCKAGSPKSVWDVGGNGDLSIQGFATDISYNLGATVQFKINTNAAAYTIDIYRLGYYAGAGARRVASIVPSATLPQTQPACATNTTVGLSGSGLADCGNWAVSASWPVPPDAVSGVYIALLTRPDTGGRSQIIFVVRDESSHSAVLYQTSDIDWQAYNYYGMGSLYGPANPPGIDLTKRAYKVSYNRPLLSRAAPMNNGLFVTEYPMIRWLEANAYDVSYFSGIDTDRLGALLPNHQLFLSVGHDEYWSGNQRANVEAARGAGVNLAFFTGNTMFWKVRFENSIDGTNTAYRTLTCYKETQANAVIDPQDPPTWTGTWRDTRFSPPADGGRPENALTGTLYMVNGPQYPGLSMQVPAADGKMRFWRNTTLATQSPGQVTTLPAGSLGYEWDIDADNGFRPAGLVPLSTATYSLSGNFLLDYGSTYGNGTATHHATLYRAPSGALVFGAGTINWTQGLDDVHDTPFPSFPADIRFQQATLNLFADMGVQPGAIQASLIPASRSTDLTPPTSAITSPSADATVTVGIPVTVSGTATDAGGGVVGAVEVSTDGGATWHPAAGRESWTYTWTPPSASSANIRTRAADDSGNVESPGSGITVSIQARSCPCSVFGTPTPSTPDGQDGNAVELGVKFRSDVSGFITGVRFYKASTNTGTHVGHLWTRDGILLATATFTGETASGWQQVTFPNAVAVSPGVTYVASYLAPVGHYSYDDLFFAVSAADNPPLHALKDGTDGGNGVFAYGPSGAFPVSSYRSRAYGVDVVFVTTVGGASGPSVTTFSPASGATGVARTAPVTITFNKALAAATVTASRFQLLDATLSPMTVNLSYNAASFTVTMVPSFGLDYGAIYTVSVAGGAGGVQDTSGNPMTASISWKFTATAAPPGSCPCTVWPSTAVPATADSGDSGAYEIGVRFRSDAAGFITGLRFFKSAANTGTHVGHLWGRDGTLLGTATFSGESASGWQQVNFASAVAIAANTTYVASYSDPAGHYSIDDLAFATSAVNTAPLHLLQDGTDGANGAFGNLGSFPSTGYRSRNYWVDVVFTTDVGGVFGPNVTAVTPASGAAGLGPATVVTATFSKPLSPASITSATFGLFDSANNPVPGSLAYDAGTATITFTPAAGLAPATSYRAAIAGGLGGITDSSGNPVRTGVAWRFSTCCAIWNSSYLPTFTDAGDATPLELGVKFRSDTAGFITGLRFYKSAANTGTHTGHLWGRDGTPLASATFTGETASGWQQASFSSAVAIAAGTTYVISYTAPAGHYSMDDLYFAAAAADNPPLHALKDGVDGVNAVFGSPGAFPTSSYRSRNYWVDAIFMTTVGGAAGPNVTAISPASSSTGVSPVASVTATFSRSLNPSSISGSTFQVFDSSQVLVPAGVTYNDSTKTATLVPSFGLTYGATYTVVLTGGSSGIKDTAGNAMAAGVTWIFSTSAPPPGSCPCTIWSSTAAPHTIDSGDGTALELGVRFHADVNGFISAVRFYKSAANTGTHVAHLWTTSGVLLASATFTGETSAGWQQATFPSTISIAAGTDYIASYSTTTGHYAVDDVFFASAGVDNAPLHASQDAAGRANGLYALGAGGVFPNSSYNSRNYWVDVVMLTSTGGVLGPTVSSVSPASGAAGVSISAPVNVVFDRAINPSTVTSSTLRLADSSNTAVPGAVSYNPSTYAATLTPSAALAQGASYTASVVGGTGGIHDANGYPMQYGVLWLFTTELPPPGTCPCSAWPSTTAPGRSDSGDSNAVTLGTKFRTDVNGWVTAIRFYKASANNGTHVVYLWDVAGGALLSSATVTGETASGWQQMNLPSPVAVTAGKTYLVSYYAPAGHYAVDLGFFAAAGVDDGPLHVLKDGADGANGVFLYGAPGSLPTGTYNSSNYWVDLVFKTTL